RKTSHDNARDATSRRRSAAKNRAPRAPESNARHGPHVARRRLALPAGWSCRYLFEKGGAAMRSLLVGTIIALALPTLAAAQDAREERHTITVTASGTITREPDRATILLAVESFAATAREAADSNATRMQAVIAALRRLGLTQEQIRTQSYDLYPE